METVCTRGFRIFAITHSKLKVHTHTHLIPTAVGQMLICKTCNCLLDFDKVYFYFPWVHNNQKRLQAYKVTVEYSLQNQNYNKRQNTRHKEWYLERQGEKDFLGLDWWRQNIPCLQCLRYNMDVGITSRVVTRQLLYKLFVISRDT